MVIGDHSGAAEPSPRRGVKARALVFAQRRKRIESGPDAYVKEVEILVEQDAVGARRSLVGKLEALVLSARAVDAFRIDHEVEGAETLADADESPFAGARPGVEAVELGQHAIEEPLEALRVECAHEAGRMERAAHVGVVDVQHVARGAAGQEVVVGAGVGEQGACADSARTATLERLQHARGVVSLPAEKTNHVVRPLGHRPRSLAGSTSLLPARWHEPCRVTSAQALIEKIICQFI